MIQSTKRRLGGRAAAAVPTAAVLDDLTPAEAALLSELVCLLETPHPAGTLQTAPEWAALIGRVVIPWSRRQVADVCRLCQAVMEVDDEGA